MSINFEISFPDWEAYLAQCEAPSNVWKRTSRDVEKDRTKWTGTQTFEEAMQLAREGWPQGRERIAELAKYFSAICSRIIRPENRMSECGDEVDVPLYLTGEPEHMIDYPLVETRAAGGKIVTVAINNFLSCGVDGHLFENRGAAILALIDALETAGYRVELQMHIAVTGHGDEDPYVDQWTVVKQADQPLELDRLAFIFMHPSVFRRLGFSVGETMPEEPREAVGYDGHYYGTPTEMKRKPEYDFIFHRMSSDDDNTCWASPANAAAEVLRLLKASKLVEISE